MARPVPVDPRSSSRSTLTILGSKLDELYERSPAHVAAIEALVDFALKELRQQRH